MERRNEIVGEAIMNILAIGAHPDDVEIFCGGTLLKYHGQGHKVFLAFTTSGNIGSNIIEGREKIASTREQEQLAAARCYDAELRFLRHDDEGLLDTPDLRRQLINAIRWADPEVIFTHCPEDPSTDHNTTAEVVGRILLSLPGKNVPADEPPIQKFPTLFHWDTAAGVHFRPELYVDISATFEDKIKALECHRSQFDWMDTFQIHTLTEHCRIMSEFRGLQAGVRYAEGFRPFRIHGYMPDFRTLPV
jgi:LmbE family N-acetylglucosaminyl deacetylase